MTPTPQEIARAIAEKYYGKLPALEEDIVAAIEQARRDALAEAAKVADEVEQSLAADDETDEETVSAQKDTAITIRSCIMFRYLAGKGDRHG